MHNRDALPCMTVHTVHAQAKMDSTYACAGKGKNKLVLIPFQIKRLIIFKSRVTSKRLVGFLLSGYYSIS